MGFGGGGGNGSIANGTDVALSNPTNNQVLTYDSSVQKWRNATSSSLIQPIPVSTFAGSTADARLSAALAYAATQPDGYTPTIQLNEFDASYSSTQTIFNGMKLVGPNIVTKFNNEVSGVNPFRVKFTGSGTWFSGSGTNYNVTIGGFTAVCTNGLGTFLTHSGLKESQLLGVQLQNWKYCLGTPTSFLALTDCDIIGPWTINAGANTNGAGPQICITGSDNQLWVAGSLNIGAGGSSAAFNGQGQPLAIFKTGKTVYGPMYFTAKNGWYAMNLQGDLTSYVGNTMTGVRAEGQNTTTPSDGAVVIVEDGAWALRDCNFNYGMDDTATANATTVQSGTGMTSPRNDRGMIQINNGRVIVDGPTYDRTSGKSVTVPLVCLADGTLSIRDAGTGAKGGTWGASKPVVRNLAGASALTADSSVTVTTS